MREVRIRSWSELHEQLFDDCWDESLRRHRSRSAFRGMASSSHELGSSLSRLGPRAAELELPMLRTFRKYAHRMAAVDDSVWSWLAVAQHHGLPTRLVDWTSYALFSLMPRVDARLEAWLDRSSEICRRVVVPAALKWEIRDKLDQANVTERVLYPGVDGLSQWLKRYYTPRT